MLHAADANILQVNFLFKYFLTGWAILFETWTEASLSTSYFSSCITQMERGY